MRVANSKGASWVLLLAGAAVAVYATNLIPAASASVVWVAAITVCLIWYARRRFP